MAKEYILVDPTNNERGKFLYALHETAAKIFLKYGIKGCRNGGKGFTDKMVREFWTYEDYPFFPSARNVYKYSKNKYVKWFIKNVIDLEEFGFEKEWNGSFLHGLALTGNLKINKHYFPKLIAPIWQKYIFDVIPFKATFYVRNKFSLIYRYAPAFYLPHDKKSINYLAGVLAGGNPCEIDGESYAKYGNKKAINYIISCEIPIERRDFNGTAYISPIWPALFVNHMPSVCRDVWLDINNAFGRKLYPPILWRTYSRRNFIRKGIPYLSSKRSIIYMYGGKGTIKQIKEKRIELGLTELDFRIREAVKEWEAMTQNNKNTS